MSGKKKHLLTVLGQFDEGSVKIRIATLHPGDVIQWLTPPYSEQAGETKKHNDAREAKK